MKEKYIKVYMTSGINNAILIQSLLSSFNIPAETSQESAGIAIGLTQGPLGLAYVYVPENYEEEAKKIIKAYENGELSEPSSPDDAELDIDSDDREIF